MALRRRSELGLAAQWRALRLADTGNQPVPLPVLLLWAVSFDTNFFLQFTESAELKVYYLIDARVIIEMLLYSNTSLAVLYFSYPAVYFARLFAEAAGLKTAW